MRLGLRACVAAIVGASCWGAFSLDTSRAEEVQTDAPVRLVEALQPLANEGPAPVQSAPQRLPALDEIPETTVVGQSAGAAAQGNVLAPGTVLETPNLTPTTLGQTGSSVSVITAEQIQQRQQPLVFEILRGLPGVQTFQAGGPGQQTSIFIRGATSYQTKVLLDGIPMNDPTSPQGGFDFANLTVDNIERIEVIRGPQSTLYGSDAMGGVINIITKKGSGPITPRFSMQGGAFGMSQEIMNVSGGNDVAYYSFGGSYYDIDGFSAADRRLTGNFENDAFQLGTFSSRVGWTPADNFDVDFITRYNQGNTKLDAGGGLNADDPNARSFNEQIYTRLQFRLSTPNELWEQTLAYNTAHYARRFDDDPDLFQPFNIAYNKNNGLTQLLDWRHNLLLLDSNTLTFGAVYQQQNYDSVSLSPFGNSTLERALRDTAVYCQDQFQFGERLFGTVGVRQDNYSIAGVATTYRTTGLYRLPITETAIRGSFGSAFRAPTIFELFDNSFFLGNPNLLPEKSQGYDFGFDQPIGDGRLVVGATVFRNDFIDFIDLPPGFPVAYTNIRNVTSTGTEATAAWTVRPGTVMTVSYTHTDVFRMDTRTRLPRRPTDTAMINVNQAMLGNRANMNASIFYVGQRDDILFDAVGFTQTPVSLPGYVLVNSAGSYNVTERFQLFGRVDNLFNQVYEQVAGFGTAGISFFGGASWTR